MAPLHVPAADEPATGETEHQQRTLVTFETISVRRFANGSVRATHGHWDAHSNRMVFTSLSNPEVPHDGVLWAAKALYNAAVEHLLDLDDDLLPH